LSEKRRFDATSTVRLSVTGAVSGLSSWRAARGGRNVAVEILIAVQVVVTAFYAWVSHRILQSNERVVETLQDQVEGSLRPFVTAGVNAELLPNLYLRIRNEGKTPAYGLRLTISRDFFSFGDRSEELNLALQPAFNQEISSFPPGSELVFPLAQSFVIFGENADSTVTPSRFWVAARYRYGDHHAEEATEIDLTPYRGAAPAPNALALELRKIRECLAEIGGRNRVVLDR